MLALGSGESGDYLASIIIFIVGHQTGRIKVQLPGNH
jgi:hypothetical protein